MRGLAETHPLVALWMAPYVFAARFFALAMGARP